MPAHFCHLIFQLYVVCFMYCGFYWKVDFGIVGTVSNIHVLPDLIGEPNNCFTKFSMTRKLCIAYRHESQLKKYARTSNVTL